MGAGGSLSEEAEKHTKFGKAFLGSLQIFLEHLQKREADQILALGDPLAWWSVRQEHVSHFAEWLKGLPPQELSEEDGRSIAFAYRYSKASYGKTMLLGLMNDAASFLYAEVTSAGFSLWEDEAGNEEAFFELADLPRESAVKMRMKGETLQPAYACVLDHASKCAVLCIRGTLTVHDAITNTIARTVEYAPVGSGYTGNCHKGMLETATWLIEEVQDAMLAAAAAHPDYRLVVTGHSLGAGAAAIITLLLAEEHDGRPRAFGFRDVQGVGFATPGVASQEVACCPAAKEVFTSVIFQRDLIPRLCVPKLDFLCYECAKHSKAAEAREVVKKWAGFSDKSYDEIKRHCEEKNTPDFEAEPHFPVGRCILVARADDSADEPAVRPAEPTDFGRVVFHERMLADHILYEYGCSLGFESPAAPPHSEDQSEPLPPLPPPLLQRLASQPEPAAA